MTTHALLLILGAAFLHASWNFLLKRSGGGGSFVWLCSLLTTLIYAPFALGILWHQEINLSSLQIAFMAGTAVLHTIYFLLLARGYRYGDLSLVYPLARGSGPLLTILIAVLLLHEQPTTLALIGAALLAIGVLLLTFDPRKRVNFSATLSSSGIAIGYALLTGATIATYTVWDKYAVATLLIPPIVLDWSSNLGRTAMMSPFIMRDLSGAKSLARLSQRSHCCRNLRPNVLCSRVNRHGIHAGELRRAGARNQHFVRGADGYAIAQRKTGKTKIDRRSDHGERISDAGDELEFLPHSQVSGETRQAFFGQAVIFICNYRSDRRWIFSDIIAKAGAYAKTFSLRRFHFQCT